MIEAHYSATPDVIVELTSLAALEADCCAFLTFAVHEAGNEAILTVNAAPGSAPDVALSLSTLTSLVTGRTHVSIDPDA